MGCALMDVVSASALRAWRFPMGMPENPEQRPLSARLKIPCKGDVKAGCRKKEHREREAKLVGRETPVCRWRIRPYNADSDRSAAKRLFHGVRTDGEHLARNVSRKPGQHGRCSGGQRHVAGITIFRVVESYKAVLQFDVLPTKRQELAAPHSRLDGQDDQRAHARIAWTGKPPFLVTRGHVKRCKQALVLTEGQPASAAAVLRRATNLGNRMVDVYAPLLARDVDDVRNEVQVPVGRRA